ncbi:FliH/SctL family protein [Candidatus Sneabacter namystus]|uniref:Flagellar assembly protein FliH/Type III secretion system HrpE domain-containing protein n=1 Tax=Candidatus Sneabacter namystus TaxID=2601646 RepID=A0A5C0UHV6_9RICK|nr:hypothetical protein [Candidatus Sneabacter namystus]QEK39636.1 hypothetical protein FZC37_01655 [Candidatus Sneabacter namystus]
MTYSKLPLPNFKSLLSKSGKEAEIQVENAVQEAYDQGHSDALEKFKAQEEELRLQDAILQNLSKALQSVSLPDDFFEELHAANVRLLCTIANVLYAVLPSNFEKIVLDILSRVRLVHKIGNIEIQVCKKRLDLCKQIIKNVSLSDEEMGGSITCIGVDAVQEDFCKVLCSGTVFEYDREDIMKKVYDVVMEGVKNRDLE